MINCLINCLVSFASPREMASSLDNIFRFYARICLVQQLSVQSAQLRSDVLWIPLAVRQAQTLTQSFRKLILLTFRCLTTLLLPQGALVLPFCRRKVQIVLNLTPRWWSLSRTCRLFQSFPPKGRKERAARRTLPLRIRVGPEGLRNHEGRRLQVTRVSRMRTAKGNWT